MKKAVTVLLLCLMRINSIHAQDTVSCKTVYDTVDESAEFTGGEAGWMRYFNKELSPIVGQCYKDYNFMIELIIFKVLISQDGKVISVDIECNGLPDKSAQSFRQKLLQMKGWVPGKANGKPVCSYRKLPMRNCWSEEE